MQDDVKAVERELRAYLDHPRSQVETLYEGHPTVLIRKAADTLATLQQRCERLEEALKDAIERGDARNRADYTRPCWSCGKSRADNPVKVIYDPEHSGGYSMAPEDTDPKLAGLCGENAPQSGEGAAGQGEATPGERPVAPECAPDR